MAIRNWWAVSAAAGAVAYGVSKVELALAGRLGLPGFPAPAESYQRVADVAAAQLGNAAVGGVAALLALALLLPVSTRRWPRRVLLLVSWPAVLLPAAGAAGFAVRAAQLTDVLGPPPPAQGPAWLTVAALAVWAGAWAKALTTHRPEPTLVRAPFAQ